MTDLTDAEIARLRVLSDRGSPVPWNASIEGRDHDSGDSFILVGEDSRRGDDMYVLRDSGPASADDLDLIAESRTQLPRLLDEIDRLRGLLPKLVE